MRQGQTKEGTDGHRPFRFRDTRHPKVAGGPKKCPVQVTNSSHFLSFQTLSKFFGFLVIEISGE